MDKPGARKRFQKRTYTHLQNCKIIFTVFFTTRIDAKHCKVEIVTTGTQNVILRVSR